MIISIQSEDMMDTNDDYITHLLQKFDKKARSNQNISFLSPDADIELFKSQLLKELSNNPIHIPLENEDAKMSKSISVNNTKIKEDCSNLSKLLRAVEVENKEREFYSNSVINKQIVKRNNMKCVQQSDKAKKHLEGSKKANNKCKMLNEEVYYLTIHNMTIVTSRRAELVLIKRPVEDLLHCPLSCMEDGSCSDMSFSHCSFRNEDMSNRSSENDDDSLASEQYSGSSDDDSSDEGDDSEDEENSLNNLIISPTSVQESIEYKHSKLNEKERIYLEHFEHAHECITKRQLGIQCPLPDCKEPQKIVDFCNQILESIPYDGDEDYEECSRALVYHALNCPGGCNVRLCKHFAKVKQELSMATHWSGVPDNYLVVLSNVSEIEEEMREGLDFTLFFLDLRGRGYFGEVFDASFDSEHTTRAHVAVKKIQRKEIHEKMMDHSISCLKRLGSHPNLLLPDIILSCSTHFLYIMQCADISLLEYITKFFQDIKDQDVMKILQFCCFYFYQMAKGIEYCHFAGFIHGDVKPGNVVLTNNFRVLKLIDWDFLREEGRQMVGGTEAYAAPEVLGKERVDKSSDVYSLCRSLYPFLYGREQDLRYENMQPKINGLINERHSDLANIYRHGTMLDPGHRISVAQIIDEFDANQKLKKLREDFEPIQVKRDHKDLSDYSKCFNFYRNWILKRLPQIIQPMYSSMDID